MAEGRGMIVSGKTFTVACDEGYEFISGLNELDIRCYKGTLTPMPSECIPSK